MLGWQEQPAHKSFHVTCVYAMHTSTRNGGLADGRGRTLTQRGMFEPTTATCSISCEHTVDSWRSSRNCRYHSCSQWRTSAAGGCHRSRRQPGCLCPSHRRDHRLASTPVSISPCLLHCRSLPSPLFLASWMTTPPSNGFPRRIASMRRRATQRAGVSWWI